MSRVPGQVDSELVRAQVFIHKWCCVYDIASWALLGNHFFFVDLYLSHPISSSALQQPSTGMNIQHNQTGTRGPMAGVF